MVSHNDRKHLMSCRGRWQRRGSLVVEAVIATALLATATYALSRLARSAAVLSQQSDQRLAATLTAENAIERLRGLSADQVVEEASELNAVLTERARCEVEISTESFASGGREGIQIRVDVSASDVVRVTLNDWRLEQSNAAPADDELPSEGDDE